MARGFPSIEKLYTSYITNTPNDILNIQKLQRIINQLYNLNDNKSFINYLANKLPKTDKERNILIKYIQEQKLHKISFNNFEFNNYEICEEYGIKNYIQKQVLLNYIQLLTNKFEYIKDEFEGANVIYLIFRGVIDRHVIVEFGESSSFNRRKTAHDYNKDYEKSDIITISKCGNSTICESKFKSIVKLKKFEYLNYKELFHVDNADELNLFIEQFENISKNNLSEFIKKFNI